MVTGVEADARGLKVFLAANPAVLAARRVAAARLPARGVVVSASGPGLLANAFVHAYVMRNQLGMKLPITFMWVGTGVHDTCMWLACGHPSTWRALEKASMSCSLCRAFEGEKGGMVANGELPDLLRAGLGAGADCSLAAVPLAGGGGNLNGLHQSRQ